MKDIRELLQTRPLLFDGAMGTYYKAAPGVECEQANLTDRRGCWLSTGSIWRQGLMPSRRIPSACPGWRRHTRPAGNSWRRQAGSWLCRPQRRRVPPFLQTSARLRIPRRFRRGRYIRLWQSSSRRWGQEFPVRDPELRCGPSGCRGDHQGGSAGCLCAGVLCGPARRLHPEGMYCKDLARRMQEGGIVDAVGLNCVSAPGAMRTLAKQLGGTLPLSVMPNAGYPVVTRTQVKYQAGRSTLRGSWAVWLPRARFRSWAAAAAPPPPTLPPCGRSWTACPW